MRLETSEKWIKHLDNSVYAGTYSGLETGKNTPQCSQLAK